VLCRTECGHCLGGFNVSHDLSPSTPALFCRSGSQRFDNQSVNILRIHGHGGGETANFSDETPRVVIGFYLKSVIISHVPSIATRQYCTASAEGYAVERNSTVGVEEVSFFPPKLAKE
jgi:nitroimidazol reductase NimA-like FMN-containing flavoprotein (pyridoxamine 5'-phosphate oxidase superfamily)